MAAAVLMKIESEDKKMGELLSLGSALQLEAARQELQRSQEQNQSQVNSSIQQQGTQAAAPKLKQAQERLNAQYAVEAQRIFKK